MKLNRSLNNAFEDSFDPVDWPLQNLFSKLNFHWKKIVVVAARNYVSGTFLFHRRKFKINARKAYLANGNVFSTCLRLLWIKRITKILFINYIVLCDNLLQLTMNCKMKRQLVIQVRA